MELPNSDRAVVDPRKVREYLLSMEHPVGRFKARFFGSIGFLPAGWRGFIAALERLAREGDVHRIEDTEFGRKYIVRGRLVGPSGTWADVESVWIVLPGHDAPHLVTVYPS